jgi:hypothetical protein
VASRVRPAGPVVAYLDSQESRVTFRGRLALRAAGTGDGHADRRVRSRVLDRIAHRRGDDEVRDPFHLRVSTQLGHVHPDRRVNLQHPRDRLSQAVTQPDGLGAAAEQAYVIGRVGNGRARGHQRVRYRLRGCGERAHSAVQVATGRVGQGERAGAGPVPDLAALGRDGRFDPQPGLLDQAQFVP